ncbi:MAG: kelch repeat-containing protein [Steroidobacteraceae bacterium]
MRVDTLTGIILRVAAPCMVASLLTACGSTWKVSATAAAGGSISPSSAIVDGGSTTKFTVTADAGYSIGSVTGCSGTLSGDTYTTGMIDGDCTVTATFATSDFVWVSGSSSGGARGAYGTEGNASSTNAPGARYGAVGWTDNSGNLWLFGGHGWDSTGTAGDLSDLWEYSPASGQWTWISGADTVNAVGVYGTQGAASSTNVPGARDGAVSWRDSSGNLWLFGGNGYDSTGAVGSLNDLWEYSPSGGGWIWVSGSSAADATGVYGTEGIAASTNVPGARDGAVSWIDSSGNLWLFGGSGYDSTGAAGSLNDLWEYSPSGGAWTWVDGSSTRNAKGAYGTEGVAASANMPGARDGAVSWIDSSGNLWLFGGDGYDSVGTSGALNDLWEYSPSSGKWTWVSGSNVGGATGIYGSESVAASANVPGARDDAVGWMDTSGNLWLFGGNGYDSTGASGPLNDLWEYSPSSGEWTWTGGSSTYGAIGDYGIEGVAASANVAGARDSAISWVSNGNLWLFGGYGYDSTAPGNYLNDLWQCPASSSTSQ